MSTIRPLSPAYGVLAPKKVKHARPELSTSSWRKTARAVKARDGWQCVVCGSSWDLVADHIIPAEEWWGHHDDPANLQTLCNPCNRSKGSLPDAEWKAAMRASGRMTRTPRRYSFGR